MNKREELVVKSAFAGDTHGQGVLRFLSFRTGGEQGSALGNGALGVYIYQRLLLAMTSGGIVGLNRFARVLYVVFSVSRVGCH